MRLRRMASKRKNWTSLLAPCHRTFPRTAEVGGTAYVIGEGGLLQALHESGYAIVDPNPIMSCR